MSNEIRHPRALAIAKKGESCLWDMGDYLIEITGKPRGEGSGPNDGSWAKMDEVSTDLIEQGYPQYTTQYMAHLRQTAAAFAPSYRVTSVSWTAHHVAGTPEILKAVIAAAKAQDRKGISKRYVLQVIDGMDADRRAKRKGVQIKAQKAADRAEADRAKAAWEKQKARDEATRKAAEKREAEAEARAKRNKERARKLKGAPKADKSKREAPKAEDVPMIVVKSKFMADSSEALALVKRMDREISPHIDDLSKAFITGSVEELLAIAEAFRKLATKLNRNQTEKRSHLHAVA